MDCNNVHPLLGPYALGALEGAERASVEAHLMTCSTCPLDLQHERDALQWLPYAADQVEPPVGLKAKLMRRIEAFEAQGRVWEEAGAGGALPSLRRGWRRLLPPRPVYSMAFSVTVVALVLVGWSTYQTLRVNDLQSRNDEQVEQVNTLRDMNNELGIRVKDQWRALNLATDPKVETVSFKGSEASPATRGSLLLDMEEQTAVMMIVDLDPLSQDEVYQVWMWDPGGSLLAVGTFRTSGEGYGMWDLHVRSGRLTYRFFGVTREPQGGSSSPTQPMLIRQENPLATQ